MNMDTNPAAERARLDAQVTALATAHRALLDRLTSLAGRWQSRADARGENYGDYQRGAGHAWECALTELRDAAHLQGDGR